MSKTFIKVEQVRPKNRGETAGGFGINEEENQLFKP